METFHWKVSVILAYDAEYILTGSLRAIIRVWTLSTMQYSEEKNVDRF